MICGLVCLGMFVRIFWDNLGHFYYAWTTDENYSHGFLVPLISLYFANQVASQRAGADPWGHLAGKFAARRVTGRAAGHDSVADPFLSDVAFLIGLAGCSP